MILFSEYDVRRNLAGSWKLKPGLNMSWLVVSFKSDDGDNGIPRMKIMSSDE